MEAKRKRGRPKGSGVKPKLTEADIDRSGIDDLIDMALSAALPASRSTTHASVASSLVLPDGPRQGKPYRWRDDPIHFHVISQLDAGRWESFTLPGAVQTGKSLVSILVPALKQLIWHRRAVVYAQPTQQKLHEAWAGKVSPAIDGAGLGGWIPQDGQGSRGGQTPKFIVFRDPKTRARAGMLYLIHGGGRSEGAQASVSAPTVLVDEVDSFKGAHRIMLIGKRADSFGRQAVRIFTSTVKADGEPGAEDGSIMLGLYQDSTRSRLWFPCEHCGKFHPLEWESVVYDDEDEGTAADTVSLACPHCGGMVNEDGRQRMLQNSRLVHHGQSVNSDGIVIGSEPRTRRFGLLWTALDSSLRDLPTLAIEHWRANQSIARGDHGAMRSFYRDQLCRPYRGDVISDDYGHTLIPTRNRLAALSSRSEYVMDVERKDDSGDSIHFAHIPRWVEHITVGVDVQRGGERAPGRLYFAAIGRGSGRGCILGWGHIISAPSGREPTEQELHASLDKLDVTLRQWGPSVPIVRRMIDVGDRQDELLRWIRSRPDWMPVKGTGPIRANSGDHPGWVYVRDQDGHWRLWMVETQSVTRIVQGELLASDGAGSMALPRDLAHRETLIMHICATVEYAPGKWSLRASDRKYHPEWQVRHDLLDCLAYARAAAYLWENKPQVSSNRRYGLIGKI